MDWYHWLALSLACLALIYVFLAWPGGLLWSMRRVYDHDRVVRSLASCLAVAPSPGTVANMLRALFKEIELDPVPGRPHPFFTASTVRAIVEGRSGLPEEAPARFRRIVTEIAMRGLPTERGMQLFSFKDVTCASEVRFHRRWEKQEPYDDFEERALVKYLRSTPRARLWPGS